MNRPTLLSRRHFLSLSMGAFASGRQREGRSEPWRIDRLRIPELQSMAERLGCFDLTDHMPRARHLFLAHLEFVAALKNAPIGVFDRYSWTFWNTVLGRLPVPPMPKRKFLAGMKS